MNLVHITLLPMFLGGGERLGHNWVNHSKHQSLHYSGAGGMKYTDDDRFLTFNQEQDLEQIIDKHSEDVIVTHDAEIIYNPVLQKVKRLIWFVHGAFTFGLDISACVKPKFVFSNYLPEKTHPSWKGVAIFPVRLGVDLEHYRAPETVVQQGNRIQVGIVGRLSDEKLPIQWFSFAQKFRQRSFSKQFEFKVYGAGMPDTPVHDMIMREIGRNPLITYMGAIDKDKVHEVYQGLDMLMVPSMTETGSYAIVESQCTGVPVVALSKDGIPDHLTNFSYGVPGYHQMFLLLANLRHRLSIEARHENSKSAKALFDVRRWAWQLDCLVESLRRI